MHNTLSPIIKITTRVLIVIGLALGVLLIPNLSVFDEELLPEISAQLNNSPKADITGNAAVYLYGLNAASSLDFKITGETLLSQLQEKHRQGAPASLSDEETNAIFKGSDFDKPWEALYPSAIKCNPRDQLDCIANIIAEIKANPITNERLLIQIERYGIIRQQPHFIEDISYLDFTSPLPNYAITLQLSRLLAAEAYLTKGMDGLIDSAYQDLTFWRLVLKESQSLIGNMVALNAIRGNLLALSYGIRQEQTLTAEQIRNLQLLLNPIPHEDANIDNTIKADFRVMVNSIGQFLDVMTNRGEIKQLMLYPMTQVNATINLSYQQFYKPAIRLSQMSPADFYEHTQIPAKPFTFSRLNPYNLGGKFTFSTPWQYPGYIGRAHDLNGLYSLVHLQVTLKINAHNDVNTAIKTSTFKNPYTQKPFDYDPTKKELGFRCFDIRDACRIQL